MLKVHVLPKEALFKTLHERMWMVIEDYDEQNFFPTWLASALVKYKNIHSAGNARNDGQGPPVVLDANGSLERNVSNWIAGTQSWVTVNHRESIEK